MFRMVLFFWQILTLPVLVLWASDIAGAYKAEDGHVIGFREALKDFWGIWVSEFVKNITGEK